MAITRQQIIEDLNNKLKDNPSVFAFWLEGADAHNSVDDYSDIDIWLDVQDGDEEIIIQQLRLILSQITELDFEYEVEHDHLKIRQIFFHLKNTSEFLIIDICVQSHSRVFWYTHGYADEKVKIIFDKNKVVQFRDLDKIELEQQLKIKIEELKKTFIFFQAWVKKEINRGCYLEALSYYHSKVLEPLVQLLRIHYQPTKLEFGLKHVERDLPKNIILKLEDLYKVNSISEISTKILEANMLFFDELKTVEKQNNL